MCISHINEIITECSCINGNVICFACGNENVAYSCVNENLLECYASPEYTLASHDTESTGLRRSARLRATPVKAMSASQRETNALPISTPRRRRQTPSKV